MGVIDAYMIDERWIERERESEYERERAEITTISERFLQALRRLAQLRIRGKGPFY